MTVPDVDPDAQGKRLHQRHINARMRVSARFCLRKRANVAECAGGKFVSSKGYGLSG